MSDGGFFYQAFVYLAAAVITVPIAKRLGLGSVLGYLIAGIAIGPFGLDFVGEKGQDIMHFAEFGVVMMLFLVGLELQPTLLWRLRGPIIGSGGLQITLTTATGTMIGLFLGWPWQTGFAVGLILAMSSTAIVLQTLDSHAQHRHARLIPAYPSEGASRQLTLLPVLGIQGRFKMRHCCQAHVT